MIYWNTIVISFCSLLLLFLLWKEIQRRDRKWLVARIAATIVAIGGLAGMVLPITYSKTISASSTVEAVLLTENNAFDSLQNFLTSHGNLPVFSLVKKPLPSGAIYLPDIAFLHSDTNRFNQLHLFGNGLNEDELSYLKNMPFAFHPTPTKTGIISISWNRQLVQGEKLQIQGRVVNNEAKSTTILLTGFGVQLDSFLVPTKGNFPFELQTEPKHLDRALYSIIVLSGKDTIAKEPLPVEVATAKPIKVFMLAAYPDFENKFLKNWLAQSGYFVAVRTRISKNKYEIGYSNMPGISINGISTGLLSQFDLVVADAAELATISQPELVALQTAVSRQGMGLLVKADSSSSGDRFYNTIFPLTQDRSTIPIKMHLQLAGDTASTAMVLQTLQPYYIRQQAGTQLLVQTDKRQIVVSSKLQGAGKILTTTLNNTYTWLLAGSTECYGTFWSAVLHRAAKQTDQSEAFSISPQLPVANEKVIVDLQTSFTDPPQVLAATDAIAMEQNWQLPYRWHGYYWPLKSGWVSFSTNHQTLSWSYIFDKNDWQNLRSECKKRQTQSRAESQGPPSPRRRSNTDVIQVEIPKLYFFLLFLLSASILWFERKYNQG